MLNTDCMTANNETVKIKRPAISKAMVRIENNSTLRSKMMNIRKINKRLCYDLKTRLTK